MYIAVKYRSLAVAITLATLFIGLYIFDHFALGDTSYAAAQNLIDYSHSSILAKPLFALQESHPIVNYAVLVLVLFVGALILNKFTIQNNLFGMATKLPTIIYLLVIVSSLDSPIILMPALCALMVSAALQALYSSTKNHHDTASLMRCALYLGVLPLLYPAMALLLPLWVLALLISDTHSYRDALTACIGVMAPTVVAIGVICVIHPEEPVVDAIVAHFRSIVAGSPYDVEWLGATSVFMLLALTISAVGLFRLGEMSMRNSLRRLVTTSNIWLFLAVGLVAVPSFSFDMMAVVAAPIALLSTVTFLHVRRAFNSVLLLVLLALCVVANLAHRLFL